MMAPYDMSDIGEPAASGYVSPNATPDSHVITPEKIEQTRSNTLLYHPLPRHDEIHQSCDRLPNAMYFEQVRLSKFMRMAVLDGGCCPRTEQSAWAAMFVSRGPRTAAGRDVV